MTQQPNDSAKCEMQDGKPIHTSFDALRDEVKSHTPEQPNDSEIDKLLDDLELLAGSKFYDFETREEAKRLIQDEILKARIDENMQTRIVAKLAYVKGGKSINTAKLIELLDERETQLNQPNTNKDKDKDKGEG